MLRRPRVFLRTAREPRDGERQLLAGDPGAGRDAAILADRFLDRGAPSPRGLPLTCSRKRPGEPGETRMPSGAVVEALVLAQVQVDAAAELPPRIVFAIHEGVVVRLMRVDGIHVRIRSSDWGPAFGRRTTLSRPAVAESREVTGRRRHRAVTKCASVASGRPRRDRKRRPR